MSIHFDAAPSSAMACSSSRQWRSTNQTHPTPNHVDKCRRRSASTGAQGREETMTLCPPGETDFCRGVTMAHDTSQQLPADPVPVTLLVGFLGSGKTTL